MYLQYLHSWGCYVYVVRGISSAGMMSYYGKTGPLHRSTNPKENLNKTDLETSVLIGESLLDFDRQGTNGILVALCWKRLNRPNSVAPRQHFVLPATRFHSCLTISPRHS